MCGIFGASGSLSSYLSLDESIKLLKHRGPDDSAYFRGNNILLGMTRLAIIDLEKQHQPYTNEDTTVFAVYNGEIYNSSLLRQKLLEKGHKFKSNHSDGEVIVHLYEEYGETFAKHLDGMFAIALWDKLKNELILVRDEFGIKPLYYMSNSNGLAFASEIKVLNQINDKEVNLIQVKNFFTFGNSMAPQTCIQNILQIQPGQYIVYKLNEKSLKCNTYYKLTNNQEFKLTDENEIAGNILQLLKESVRQQTNSDVGFATLLSGGLDSSAISIFAAEISSKKLQTYCAYYPELQINGKNDDRQLSKLVSDYIDSEHYELAITSNDIKMNFDAIYDAFDEPFAGVTTNYFVSKTIAENNKVALTGDGSDEMFGSYQLHRVAHILETKKIEKSYSPEDVEFCNISESQLMKLQESSNIKEIYTELWRINYGELFTKVFKNIDNIKNSNDEIRFLNNDLLSNALTLDFQNLLPNQILPFVDRLSMLHSVELRPPFLNKNLVNYVFSLDGALKIKNRNEKYILKKALAGILPSQILNRKKEGFVLPLTSWLNGPLKSWYIERLSNSSIRKNQFVNSNNILELLKKPNLNYQEVNLLWRILVFQNWWDKNFE